MKVYCYRYMWLYKGDEHLQVKIIVGSSDEHLKFIDCLEQDKNVKNACRVYQYEIDIDKIEEYESIVKNNEEEDGEDNA